MSTDGDDDASGHEQETLDLARKRALVRLLEVKLALREKRLAKMRPDGDGKPAGLSSPAMVGIITALITGGLGLAGGAVVNALQARANSELERQKLESSLILKAIETGDRATAASNLAFLVSLGFIHDPSGNILALESHPQAGPVLPAAGERGIEFRGESKWNPQTIQSVDDSLESFGKYWVGLGATVSPHVVVSIDSQAEMEAKGMLTYYDRGTIHLDERLKGDVDLTMHEFSHHALIGPVDPGELTSDFRALEAGLATYFVCSFRERSVFGRDIPRDIGSRPLDLGERRSVRAHYTDQMSVLDGEAEWGSTLWAIRGTFGKETADAAIASAWFALAKDPRQKNVATGFVAGVATIIEKRTTPSRLSELSEIFRSHGVAGR